MRTSIKKQIRNQRYIRWWLKMQGLWAPSSNTSCQWIYVQVFMMSELPNADEPLETWVAQWSASALPNSLACRRAIDGGGGVNNELHTRARKSCTRFLKAKDKKRALVTWRRRETHRLYDEALPWWLFLELRGQASW